MIGAFQNAISIPELKRRILFTLAMIFVYRIGSHVPTPGINATAMQTLIQSQAGGVLGFMDLFSGGALSQFSVFALGIMPYISTSIIIQLLTAVVPYLERLSKEGEQGRKKITQYTRYGTVLLCIIQSVGMTYMLNNVSPGGGADSIVLQWGLGFQITTVLTLTSGTIFIMWLGEQISERGIGNGMSIIIFAGIVARLPMEIGSMWALFQAGSINLIQVLIFLIVLSSLVGLTVIIQQSFRKIPVQYAQRVVGRKVYRGQSTQLPLKVDYSGVIAVIFASSVLITPTTLAKFFENPNSSGMSQSLIQMLVQHMSPGSLLYTLLYAFLIVFFCYFYTAITFNPTDVAENMKKYGGFIPGLRPGKSTAEYIDQTLSRITLGGSLAIVVIAILPDFLAKQMSIGWYFGGTTLLIVVGVALDTMKQIESHLLMRHYEGFMKQGKLKGRTSF
ncbi:preprotein translocase subunit SecY [bacterium]|nr:preprotein translocase subunit SecY [bacterium]